MQLPVYLDYHATTPCDPIVMEAMLPFFTQHFGNAASRTHVFGWKSAEAVLQAREQVAALIGSEPEEIVFTSGATESDNLALKGVFEMYPSKGNHIITCKTEHKAVLDTCNHVEKTGGEVTYLDVNADGLIDLAELEKSIRPTTILISIMYANNETGVVQPVKDISAIARKHNVIFFTDATQAAGKIPIDVNKDGIDLMALSAHKLYGPKGAGALYIRRKNPRIRVTAQMDGGGHERGARSGTLNVPGIVGFGKACQLSMEHLKADADRIIRLRDKLEKAILQTANSFLNGAGANRLPTVSNLSFKGIDGQVLLTVLNKKLAVSSGSACSSASMEPSHVLKAMGLSDEMAYASIRFSLGRFTTEAEIDFATEQVRNEVEVLRKANLLWEKTE
ncbi:MAG: IscS subfamily cysteine desulfurase [Chitinophagaceae bacterium]|nr:IscS subfamily cysteine desulfurase [Chitinophagaceae bacterium]